MPSMKLSLIAARREVLAKVFKVRRSEVDEMIRIVLKPLAMRIFAAKSYGRGISLRENEAFLSDF